jgi:ribosomal protein S4E
MAKDQVEQTKKTRKVTSRRILQDGRVVLEYEDGMVTMLTIEQIKTMKEIGDSIPAAGTDVMTDASVNFITGEVSDRWVVII